MDPDNIDAACMLILRPASAGATLEVLTCSRRDKPAYFDLPGGKREPTDSDPVYTAIRETMEETGVIVQRQHMQLLYVGTGMTHLCATYHASQYYMDKLRSPEPGIIVSWRPLIQLVSANAAFRGYNIQLLRALLGEPDWLKVTL